MHNTKCQTNSFHYFDDKLFPRLPSHTPTTQLLLCSYKAFLICQKTYLDFEKVARNYSSTFLVIITSCVPSVRYYKV